MKTSAKVVGIENNSATLSDDGQAGATVFRCAANFKFQRQRDQRTGSTRIPPAARAFVRESIRRLNEENLEHHHRIKWRAPALRPVRMVSAAFSSGRNASNSTAASNASSWSPRSLNPLQAIIDIEKSRLPSHRIIPDPPFTRESERRRIGEVLRSIQVIQSFLPRFESGHVGRRLIGIVRQPSSWLR